MTVRETDRPDPAQGGQARAIPFVADRAGLETGMEMHLDGEVLDRKSPAAQFTIPPGARLLDSVQLAELERSFRVWSEDSPRADVRRSRKRILFIFLLIRFTGAKLHEILDLGLEDMDFQSRMIRVGGTGPGESRFVEISDEFADELRIFLAGEGDARQPALFRVDPGHVRRKFYERAEACGLPREFGNPSTLRRSRSMELLRANVPLPVVQKLLGHSTPNLTASVLDVSDEDMHHLVRQHIDRESRRRTSARNIFFGKIIEINTGDIQSEIVVLSLGGLRVSSIITNGSLHRMRLKTGTFVAAEIKAPWVHIAGPDAAEQNSAENRLKGTVVRVKSGQVNAEVLLRLADDTEICAVITTAAGKRLKLHPGDEAWALFGAYAVILNVEN